MVVALSIVRPGCAEADGWWQTGWTLTGWSGRLTTENTTDLWTGRNWTFENSYLAALAASKEITPFRQARRS